MATALFARSPNFAMNVSTQPVAITATFARIASNVQIVSTVIIVSGAKIVSVALL